MPALHPPPTSVLVAILLATALACDGGPSTPDGARTVRFDLADDAPAWEAGFAEYQIGAEAFYELVAEVRARPAPLDQSKQALYLSGNNHSDDLFMYATRRIDGLTPGARYSVTLDVELATNSPTGCFGVGGAPGESVYLNAGAAPVEPVTLLGTGADPGNPLNVDHGGQAMSGRYAAVLGDLGNGLTDCDNPEYRLKAYAGAAHPIEVVADGVGAVWLLVGVDSAFEATTSVYLTSVTARLLPK